MALTEKDLDHVINLAHLEIEPSEKGNYLSQIQDILEHMKNLDEINLDNLSPTAYANEQATYLRPDEVIPQPDLLIEKNAPMWDNQAFRVPKIV